MPAALQVPRRKYNVNSLTWTALRFHAAREPGTKADELSEISEFRHFGVQPTLRASALQTAAPYFTTNRLSVPELILNKRLGLFAIRGMAP